MSLSVVASRDTSSFARGTGSLPGAAAVTAAARRRIASTGRSAAAASP